MGDEHDDGPRRQRHGVTITLMDSIGASRAPNITVARMALR
jgi:hypothetical protein